MKVAAIDIGTNSTRLLIAEVSAGAITKVWHREANITRFGQEVAASKRLNNTAIQRTVRMVQQYQTIASRHNVNAITVVATSAAREAVNASDFVDMVKRLLGLEVKILDGQQEARLMFLGATSDPKVAPEGRRLLVIDIGGGSTELVIGHRNHPEQITSFDIGCVGLQETFLTSDPPPPEQLNEVFDLVDGLLRGYWPADRPNIEHAVAVAGTPTALAAIEYNVVPYSSEAINGSLLSIDQVQALLNRLSSLSVARRRDLPALEPARADVIVSGTAILLAIMRFFDVPSVTVSERDILDGLALQAARSFSS